MDENVLNLHLISTQDSQTVKINWIEIESPTGNFVICLGHAPITSLLTKKSTITYQLLDSTIKTVEIQGGIMLLKKTNLTILLD